MSRRCSDISDGQPAWPTSTSPSDYARNGLRRRPTRQREYAIEAAPSAGWIDDGAIVPNPLCFQPDGGRSHPPPIPRPVMPRLVFARRLRACFPPAEGSPADQNGGHSKPKNDGGAATGPRGLRWRDIAPAHGLLIRPWAQVHLRTATTGPNPQSHRKRGDGVALLAKATYTAAGPHFAFHFSAPR